MPARPLIVLLGLALMAIPLLPDAARAESRCVDDPAGDVRDQSDDSIGAQPPADLLAVCADYDGAVLRLSARVAEPTDPATSPDWDDFATAIGFGIDTDGDTTPGDPQRQPAGEDFFVNLGRFTDPDTGQAGPPEARTQVGGTNDIAGGGSCIHALAYDGVRYRVEVPASCLGNPDQVQVAGFMFFRSSVEASNVQGFYDEAPPFPDYIPAVGSAPDVEDEVQRRAGPSRVETATAVSVGDFADGAAESVVLARADAAPDALAAAPLAVATNGPVLLTQRTSLPDSVLAEMQRILPAGGTVYLSGGTAAIGEEVATAVTDAGYTVSRVAGDSRYTTSVAVARAADPEPTLIVVADGNDFPDALVGGALAAAEGGVQVLSNGATLTEAVADYLAEHPAAEVVAVGASAAEAVPTATVLAGSDPFATSVVVAERYTDPDGVALASGTNFPDGLSGGASAGRAGVPLLLSWPDVLPDSVAAHLQALTPVRTVTLYGGTAALSHQVAADAAAALG